MMNFNLLSHIRGLDETRVVWLFNIGLEAYWNGEQATIKDAKGDVVVNHMEEMNLLITRPQDIMILRTKPDEAYLKELEARGFTLPTIVTPSVEDETRGISYLVTEDEALIVQIKELLSDTEDKIFVPYGVTTIEENIARQLGLTLFGSPNDINKAINDKIFSRKFALEHGMAVSAGEIVSSLEELEKVAADYLGKYGRIIIKEPCGASGKGLWIVDSERKLKTTMMVIKRFFKDATDRQWLVEQWCDKLCDLNYQVYVGMDGTVEVFSIKEQLCNDVVYIGSVMPPRFSKELQEECVRCGEIIGKGLHEMGYVGILGIDAMILKDGTLIPIIEINGRHTLSTYISFLPDRHPGKQLFSFYHQLSMNPDRDCFAKTAALVSAADKDAFVYTSETIRADRVGDAGRVFIYLVGENVEEKYNNLLEVLK